MKTLVDYAKGFVGLPYRWGGDDTIQGFDCSGLVQEILASAGEDPPGDQTADMIFRHFLKLGCPPTRKAGALAFFGELDKKIIHVGFMIDGWRMVEAGGGGSKTRTADDAAKQNAYVRIRPLSSRKDLVTCIMPHYKQLLGNKPTI